jgi:uncharacterized membrane protein YgcG
MKKLFVLIAAALLVLLVPSSAFADEAYSIYSDDVYITVQENNVIGVTEVLTVDFTQPRHGIYYTVPYKGTWKNYINGEWTEVRYTQRITDFNVDGRQFELSKDGANLVAKIGDPDEYVTGRQVYTVTYMCNMGDNGFDTFDMFYKNVLNCYAEDTIENASFTITFPKDFDKTKVNVTLGSSLSDDTAGVVWEKDGLTLKGNITRPLRGGEHVTVWAEFPDDYFQGETDPEAAWNIGILIATGVCVVTALIMWLLLGRDSRVYPTVEFYAPDGMTPAEAGYVIDGCVDDKDVIALLLYWADKGNLRIDEPEKGNLILTKLRDLPEDAKNFERIMFGRLFQLGDMVSVSSLKQSFYTTMEQTKTSVKNYFESSKARRVFTQSSKRARSVMAVVTMLPIAVVMFKLSYDFLDKLAWAAGLAVAAGWVISLPVMKLAGVFEHWRSTPAGKRFGSFLLYSLLLIVVFAVYLFVVPLVMETAYGLADEVLYATAASAVVMMALTVIMRKRTDKGNEWYGKLLGFKNFIEKAEKERILLLVEQNPSYFYNVLPYAYVLGVTDKWAKKFEGIGVQPPAWYGGYYGANMFNTMVFTSYMTRNLYGFQAAMTSRPPQSSGKFGGGGFGGGGFSGGGFGGGGAGGSW